MSEVITEESYKRLKREVEEAKSEASRAQGALDQLLTRLKEEFECDTLEAAKKALAELGRKKEEAQEKFEKAMKSYQEKWMA